MERIGSIWTMIVRYLLLVMFGGVIVWACNSAGISVYADDGETPDGAELIRFDFHKSVNQEVGIPAGIPGFFHLFFMKEKNIITDSGLTEMGQGQRQKSLVLAYVWAPYTVIYYDAAGGEIEITVRQQQAEEGCLRQGEMVKSLKPGRNKGKEQKKICGRLYCVWAESSG